MGANMNDYFIKTQPGSNAEKLKTLLKVIKLQLKGRCMHLRLNTNKLNQ